MPYATPADLALAMPPVTLRQLANDDPAAESPDPTIVQAALDHASARIDAALAAAGARLPDPPPAIIREAAVGLARAWLYHRRPEGMDYPEAVRREADALAAMLKAIAAGQLRIGATGQPSGTLEVARGARARDWGMLA